MKLILASSSPHRRALLDRLRLTYSITAPGIDEQPHPDERPAALVERQAREKARAVAGADTGEEALIIAADQTASLDGQLLSKPGTLALAEAQLRQQRGRTVTFYTGLCLLNAGTGRCQAAVESCEVRLRHLSDAQIRTYVATEAPLDAAGAFKSEGFGIALFESIVSNDPTTLVGLPLIRLVAFLANEGLDVFS
jgi:MAF protein